MKKSLFIVLMALFVPTTILLSSQIAIAKVREVVKINNQEVVANEVATILTNTLSLDNTQTKDVADLFAAYIKNTNGISHFNGKRYYKNISSINYNLMQDLSVVFSNKQYMKFVNLNGARKPSVKSLFNNLSGGLSMSAPAKSVLTGLLMNNYMKR